MAAQQGRLMLLKIGNGGSPETFTTVAGVQNTKLTINASSVDVTNADSAGQWKEMLSGAGLKSISASGSGVFKDTSSENAVITALIADTIINWQVIVPSLGTFQGAFHIDSVEYAGKQDGEVTYSISLSSAGQITYTAA
jgi:TP901-1 family phage major tail protein